MAVLTWTREVRTASPTSATRPSQHHTPHTANVAPLTHTYNGEGWAPGWGRMGAAGGRPRRAKPKPTLLPTTSEGSGTCTCRA
jgi:hypothetical protein